MVMTMATKTRSPFLQFAQNCQTLFTVSALPEDIGNTLSSLMKSVITDPLFLDDCFGKGDWDGKKILYEDPMYGFCICGHINQAYKESSPHHHGASWAIYGQVAGETEMTDWAMVSEAEGEEPGKVAKLRTYTLKPGDVYFYPVGAIHSPARTPGRLLRIEGQNLSQTGLCYFEPV